MTPETFREQLLRDGYLEVGTKSMEPGGSLPAHSHPYDVRLMVLEGDVVIDCGNDPRKYRAGDVCEVACGVEHTEQYGTGGYTFMYGRRYPKS